MIVNVSLKTSSYLISITQMDQSLGQLRTVMAKLIAKHVVVARHQNMKRPAISLPRCVRVVNKLLSPTLLSAPLTD